MANCQLQAEQRLEKDPSFAAVDGRKDEEHERDRLPAADADVGGVESSSAERTSCCAVAVRTFVVACSANVEFYSFICKKIRL